MHLWERGAFELHTTSAKIHPLLVLEREQDRYQCRVISLFAVVRRRPKVPKVMQTDLLGLHKDSSIHVTGKIVSIYFSSFTLSNAFGWDRSIIGFNITWSSSLYWRLIVQGTIAESPSGGVNITWISSLCGRLIVQGSIEESPPGGLSMRCRVCCLSSSYLSGDITAFLWCKIALETKPAHAQILVKKRKLCSKWYLSYMPKTDRVRLITILSFNLITLLVAFCVPFGMRFNNAPKYSELFTFNSKWALVLS